jgi:L-arabinonolactonase
MTVPAIECVVPARALLGECPVWSPLEELLYWIDIDGRAIHRYDPVAGTDESRLLSGRPGSIALTPFAGRLLVAMENRLAFFDWTSESLSEWTILEPGGTGNRLNDGRCDPVGRFWVGSMFESAAADRSTGMLHRIEPNGSSSTVRSGIGVSNGLAFSPDGSTMYFADTPREMVWAYDYDLDTGEATRERPFVDFGPIHGRPDGACVDEEGCYWVAAVYGWSVLRVTPSGIVDRKIDLPIEKPTMPAFGGRSLTTLFVTSVGMGGSIAPADGQHDAGGLFAFEPGVRGISEPRFAAVAPP